MMNVSKLLRAPIVTEASRAAVEANNVYTFSVHPDATKYQIGKAIELLYDVNVIAVRVLNVKSQTRRFRRSIGKTAAWKKAFVQLQEGQSLDNAKENKG